LLYLILKRTQEGREQSNFDYTQEVIAKVNPEASSDEAAGPKVITLRDCFNKFAENEQLPESETLYCSHCKEHNAPLKKMDLWRAPNVLIIQLKRFQYIPGQYFVHRDKISDLVEFPLEGLDLSEFIKGPVDATSGSPIYDLFGVSEHSGGLGGGHYTACCKNAKDGRW
jgi:ubiquitin carboxyl-terminal hydrolase 4/11